MLTKLTSCASHQFQATLPDARSYSVLVAKRAFEFGTSGALVPRQEQELLYFSDEAYGEINKTSLLYPSDIVPYKPASDIVIAANTYTPVDRPAKSWECGVLIEGETCLEQRLKVYGPRNWEPKWRLGTPNKPSSKRLGFSRWVLSDAEPTTSVEIRYENAWGGLLTKTLDDGTEETLAREENPLGKGWIDPELTDHTKPIPAPQLEWVGDEINDPDKAYAPACFGPVMPAWLPRRPLGGTFDQDWIENKRPWWPEDYDFAYHNAVPKALQWDGFLRGDETVLLKNMVAGSPSFELKMFETGLLACYGDTEQKMALDTLLLDIRSPDKDDWLITLTWRLVLPPDMVETITLDEVFVAHQRYKQARAPFAPGDVAKYLEEKEAVNG